MQKKAGSSARPGAILAAGAAVQLLTGLPAAWGVFQQPVMEEYALGEAGATAAFSILIAAYGVGCVMGGFLQDRHGPRCGALWGTALLCGGLAGAALLPAKAGWAMGLAFSIPAGLGTAFLYPSIQSCVQKWYQGRKGFATGITGAAAGLSGAFLTLLVRLTVPRWGIRGAFWTLAGAALPVCLAGAALLTDPPGAAKQGQKAQGPDYTPGQMLRTRQYWLKKRAGKFLRLGTKCGSSATRLRLKASTSSHTQQQVTLTLSCSHFFLQQISESISTMM